MPLPNRNSRVANPFDRFEQTLPKLPDAVLEQFPELRDWQDEMETWFANLRQTIETNQDVLLAKIQELDS